jgi:hypothetical protein
MADIELRMTAVDEASSAIGALAGKLEALVATIVSFESIKAIGEQITGLQTATLELNKSFEQFGATAQVSMKNLTEFADQVLRTTTISRTAALEGEAALLRYGSVVGATFDRAREVMINLAAQMGGDTTSAANILGRALERPETAARALRAAHIVLSAATQQLIKDLVANGQTADAQSVILHEFETRLVAAKDRADTLGGSLQQLKNTIAAAFEGNGANIGEFTDAIHRLSAELNKPENQAAIERFVAAMAHLATILATLTSIHLPTWVGTLADWLNEFGRASLNLAADVLDRTLTLLTKLKIAGVDVGDTLRKATDPLYAQLRQGAFLPPGGHVELSASARAGYQPPNADYIQPTVHGGLSQLEDAGLPPQLGTRLAIEKDRGSELDKLYEQWYQATRSAKQKILDEWSKFDEELKQSLAKGTTTPADAEVSRLEELTKLLPDITTSAKQVKIPLEEASAIGKRFSNELEHTFASMFENMGKGAQNFGDIFINMIKRIFAEAAAHDLVAALGLDQIGVKGGSGSGLGALFGLFGGGAGAGAAAWGSDAAALGVDSASLAALAVFDSGGFTTKPVIAGEHGPEYIMPGYAGVSILNSQMTAANLGGGATLYYSPATSITGTGLSADQLSAVIAVNNDRQKADMMRLLQRNGVARLNSG